MVFSIIRNVDCFVKVKKDVDIFKKSHVQRFNRSSEYYVKNSKRIYNDIENGYYTLTELAIFLLYRYMLDCKKINLYSIKYDSVKKVMLLFTNKRREDDLELLKYIYTEMKFKRGKCEFFDIKEDGTNLAYVLVKKERISPIFFIRNFEKCLTSYKEDDIFKSKEYEQFERIVKKIKHIL